MPSFEPPNPYGSYFNFNSPFAGDPSPGMWRNPNYPNLNMPTSQGVAGAMGMPAGGFNPTQNEFLESRRRDIAYQQFVAQAVKDDARTRTIGSMVMHGMYGNDARRQADFMSRIGGASAYNGIIGTVMSLPGISGYLGGSPRSMPVGALAMASSGLTMNGYGVYGDKGLNVRFADSLMSTVNQRFYGSNGNPILGMTNGLNRDQMGGVMVQAASQGAFSGLDMGSFQKMDQAGRTSKFIANEGTLNKMTEFIKTTTKALGSLIDVYGNISSGELLQKAQEITGLDLSRMENAGLINSRISGLRQAGKMAGIDPASMFDMAARGGDIANQFGLDSSFGAISAVNGIQRYRGWRQQTSGFFAPAMSAMDAIGADIRDTSGMARDPLGSRLAAMQLLIKNSGMDPVQAAQLRGEAQGIAATPGGVGQMDRFIASKFGVNASGFIRSMGGAMNMMHSLDPESQDQWASMARAGMGVRQNTLLKNEMLRAGSNLTGGQMDAMHLLMTSFNDSTIGSLLRGGDTGDALGLVSGGNDAKRAQLLAAVGTIKGMGEGGVTAYHNFRSMEQSNPLLKLRQSEEMRRRNGWMQFSSGDIGERGALMGPNFIAGMLDKFSGDDPVSQLKWLAATDSGKIAGLTEGITFDMSKFVDKDNRITDRDGLKENTRRFLSGLKRVGSPGYTQLLHEMSGMKEDDGLRHMVSLMQDPDQLQRLMQGTKQFATADGNVVFAASADMDNKGVYGNHFQVLTGLAGELDKQGRSTEANMLRAHASAIKTGAVGKRTLTPDELAKERSTNNLAGAMVQSLLSGPVSDSMINMLHDSDLGGAVSGILKQREEDLGHMVNDPDYAQKQKKIQELRDKISATDTGTGMETTSMTGNLRLMFEDVNVGKAMLEQVKLHAPTK